MTRAPERAPVGNDVYGFQATKEIRLLNDHRTGRDIL